MRALVNGNRAEQNETWTREGWAEYCTNEEQKVHYILTQILASLNTAIDASDVQLPLRASTEELV